VYKKIIVVMLAFALLLAAKLEASETVQDGGTLIVGWLQEQDTLNPLATVTVQGDLVFRELLYDTLLGYGKNLEPVPWLAKKWEKSEDGLQWTFWLVHNAKWHDGEPLTAEDVKFTIEYVKDNKLPVRLPFVENIDKVEVLDRYTIKVYYTKLIASVLSDFQGLYIVPKHKWEKISGEEALKYPNPHPIGSGPFKFVKWEKKNMAVYETNTEYWQGRPYIDKVVFKYYANINTMLLALKKGEIDVIPWEVPEKSIKTLAQLPNIKTVAAERLYYRWISINSSTFGKQNPTLRDVQVRLALNHAIDRDLLIKLIHLGYASPGVSIVSKATPFWFNNNLKPYKFDLGMAREILEKAGYKDRDGDGVRESSDGTKLEYTLLVLSRWPEEMRTAEKIRDWWKEIGVKLHLQSADGGTICSYIYPNYEQDMFLWGFSARPDPNFSLNILREKQIQMWNDSGWVNPEYESLYDKQICTLDPAKRQEIVYRMQEVVYENAGATVLYYMKVIGAYRSDRFTGFVNMPNGIMSMLNAYSLRNVHQIKK